MINRKGRKGNILLILVSGIALVAVGIAGYFFWQNRQLQQESSIQNSSSAKSSLDKQESSKPYTNPTSTTSPAVTPTPVPAPQGETANWQTFVNSAYGYSLSAPSDFSLSLCRDCNPPEIDFSLENKTKTISVGANYAHQGSLTGNATFNEYTPAHNLKVTIRGKTYVPEEYYDNIYKKYIFKIDDVSNNGQFSQISLSGEYAKPEDALLVSRVLSTFKFL